MLNIMSEERIIFQKLSKTFESEMSSWSTEYDIVGYNALLCSQLFPDIGLFQQDVTYNLCTKIINLNGMMYQRQTWSNMCNVLILIYQDPSRNMASVTIILTCMVSPVLNPLYQGKSSHLGLP